ncbi:hypothetical protein CH75_12905 [Dyella jiangningensis]|nr:hypothetical protein CH75_12905 [Dyella jiangningensis]
MAHSATTMISRGHGFATDSRNVRIALPRHRQAANNAASGHRIARRLGALGKVTTVIPETFRLKRRYCLVLWETHHPFALTDFPVKTWQGP